MMDVHFISHQINREEVERLIVLSGYTQSQVHGRSLNILPKHLRELRDAILLDQFMNQKELADHLGTDQSTVSRRMSNAIQLGILTSEGVKDAYKLAKEKEVEFDEEDF